MQENRPIVLTIAGFDPCGGAGVLADVKTFEQLKTQGMAITTANTIQTEDQFIAIEWQDIEKVQQSIKTIMQHYVINVIKIGIVKDSVFLKNIMETIKTCNTEAFIIWDPIFKSSSGFTFFKEEEISQIFELLTDIDLLTPNFEEYQLLESVFELPENSKILIKGGHRKEQIGIDILKIGTREISISPINISIYPKHGSGCVLSSAIAAGIALGKDLEIACQLGKKYVEQYLNSNSSLLGHHHD